jgi:hypothetical protein
MTSFMSVDVKNGYRCSSNFSISFEQKSAIIASLVNTITVYIICPVVLDVPGVAAKYTAYCRFVVLISIII